MKQQAFHVDTFLPRGNSTQMKENQQLMRTDRRTVVKKKNRGQMNKRNNETQNKEEK